MAYNAEVSKGVITRLRALEDKLSVLGDKIRFEINNGKGSAEEVEVIEAWSKAKNAAQELEFLVDGITGAESALKTGELPEFRIETVKERLERDKISAERKTKSALRIEIGAEQTYNQYKSFKGSSNKESEEEKEEKDRIDKELKDKKEKERSAKEQKEKEKKEDTEAKKKEKDKPKVDPEKTTKTTATTPAEKFEKITKEADRAVAKFNKQIPAIQKDTYDSLQEDLRKLDLQNGNIKTTVKNLSLINSIKNKLNRIILTDGYKSEVKDFARSFNEIARLQNEYWKGIDKEFKPKSILKAIREQSISDTVGKLTEAGIGANIAEPIADILRTNITTGGSYKKLTEQLRENLVNTQTPGTMEKYIGQITTDAVNQFSNQYTQLVSSDLGYEWFKYDNTDILTTRHFCDAMTDRPYFHISEIPALLRGEGLTYLDKKTGDRKPVEIYAKTSLPYGMIPGTDASNFFIRRGGYRCGHSIRPVNERQVPEADKDRVFVTSAYIAWKNANK